MAQATQVNFLGGSPLNRLSWLRTSHSALNAIAASPQTRWILFSGGQPLITSGPSRTLAKLTTEDVRPLLGPAPLFGQTQAEGEIAPADVSILEAARLRGAPLVFLGLHEPEDGSATALPSSEFTDPAAAVARLTGTPYFSLDVADYFAQDVVDSTLKNSSLAKDGTTLEFVEPRGAMNALDFFTAGLFAGARSMVDWNTRNKFCPACGSPSFSAWAGWKLSCTTLLPWADNTGRKPCPTIRGLHNFTHPRSDAVVIMLAVNEAGDKALMGRNKKFPGSFYSALAGFIEPGESLEDAVRREMWEEAGVRVGDVAYHSTQPWPYPANLMVGFFARADESAPVRTDLDNELEDARWFTRAEVLAVLSHRTGTRFGGRELRQMRLNQEGRVNVPSSTPLAPADGKSKEEEQQAAKEAAKAETELAGEDEPPFRVPPTSAIAGVLIRDWAEGRVEGWGSMQKGNL